MLQTLWSVISRPTYALLALASAVAAFILLLWLSEISLFHNTLFNPVYTFALKGYIIFTLLKNTSLLSLGILLTLATLVGTNIATLTYYFKNKISAFRASHATAGVFGVLFGILGLGCAACGSFVLMTILPFFGIGTLLSLLPLHGQEFGLAGAILLFIALRRTLREIANPLVCPVQP